MEKKIFVVSGPSGSGKTTVLEKTFRKKVIKDNFFRVLTVTSRAPRAGESNGKDYYFVSKEEFKKLKEKGWFFETKRYLDNFYGTPKDFLEQAEEKDKHPVLCIEVDGAFRVKDFYKEIAVLIFILPPSEKTLSQRLEKRKTEKTESLKKRLRIAKKEVKYAEKYDYSLVNEDINKVSEELKKIFLKKTGR